MDARTDFFRFGPRVQLGEGRVEIRVEIRNRASFFCCHRETPTLDPFRELSRTLAQSNRAPRPSSHSFWLTSCSCHGRAPRRAQARKANHNHGRRRGASDFVFSEFRLIGSTARGTLWLNCSMHGPRSRTLNNAAIACYDTNYRIRKKTCPKPARVFAPSRSLTPLGSIAAVSALKGGPEARQEGRRAEARVFWFSDT